MAATKKTTTSTRSAIERARRYLDDAKRLHPGQVARADAALAYYWLDPTEMRAGRLRKLRDDLRERGFDPLPEDCPEYVPGCSTAEIWAAPKEVADILFDARKQRDEAARAAIT